MLNVIFTVDYEIHATGDGSPYELMIEPTERTMRLFEEYGAKLTIFADVPEILKFREYKQQIGRDDYHYEAIVAQMRDAIRRGHDVQLHIHSSYLNAKFEQGRWIQDWSEYHFAGLSENRINEVIRLSKEFLEEQLRPVNPVYRCDVFRAANWAMKPSRTIVQALVRNGFRIDSSVFKYGRRGGTLDFDYSHIPSNLVPWMVSEDDICQTDANSSLMEVPIYAERRWVGAFLTLQRIYRARLTKQYSVSRYLMEFTAQQSGAPVENNKFKRLIGRLIQKHSWKADFNQCTGRQLIKALERAAAEHDDDSRPLPFVLIGHSKLFTQHNERSLRSFLAHVRRNPDRLTFVALSDIDSDVFGIAGSSSTDSRVAKETVA